MSRRVLRQAVFDLPDNIPPAKRKSALDLLVRKWSPFPSTGYATVWADHKASVYAWDRDQVDADIAAAGYNHRRCSAWPETFLREPLTDGFRLAVATDGFEGQMWRNGFLTTSRWWDTVPAPRDWLMFLRSAGVDLHRTPPEQPSPTEPPFLPTPWTVGSSHANDIWSLLQTERAISVAAAVVAVPFLYLIGQALVISIATARADATMAEMAETNQTVRIERSAALTDLDSIEAYLSLKSFPPQIEILTHASTILGGRNLTISEWVYDNGNLELTLESLAPLDSTFYIEAFEKDDLFSSVSGSSGVQQKTLRLNMQIAAQEWPAQ